MLATRKSVQDLVDALPEGVVLTDEDGLDKYRWDRALDPAAERPLAAVRVETTEHVQTTMRWASDNGVPVVTRGAGTGLSGGATALGHGIVLSTERMRAIEIDAVCRIAVVQPGLLNAEVKAAAAEHGLWYPPDPSSYEICSIGGNIATNAGGLCCVKYGVTTDYVLGMQVVLSDGRAVRFGGPRVKDVAGLSLHKLFVGSEGTLGVITEVTLRLLPAAPPAHTIATWFATTQDATAAILDITSAIRPSMLEYMDHASINAVEDELHMGLERDAAALLIARTDSGDPREPEAIIEACERHHASEVFSTSDEAEGEMFAAARRAAIPAVEKGGRLLLEDVGVPLPRFPDLVGGIEKIAADRGLTIALIAHAGDGNTHPLIVFDPSDPDMERRAQLAFGEIMDLAISLGGTITGEHGVGRMKQPWLEKQVGADVVDVCAQIKRALDPGNILNPGAILK